MIMLTRPDGSRLLVNPGRIETVEQMPDTVITLADGKKLLVRESADVVAALFLAHQRAIHAIVEGNPDDDAAADALPSAWPTQPAWPASPAAVGDVGPSR